MSISQISSGTAVSVSNAGVATIANGAGTGNTVTITGFPTTLRNTNLAANSGLQVQTTTTLHTYTFHKQLASADDIQAISATVNSFSNRYRVSSSAPQTSLDSGDLWYDTTNSKLMVYSGQNSAWEEATAIGNFFISTLSSSSSTGGGSATANGTAYRFTLSDAPTNAQQLLVGVDGVIQKPNSGSSQPSEGYVLVGNDIIFSAAPHNGASIFVTVIGSTVGIGTPSNNTVTSDILQNGSVIQAKLATGAVTSDKILDGTIVNADINGSAAIAGTKIDPDFGSLNITTGGNITSPVLVAQGASGSGDGIILINSGGGTNSDFARIRQVLSDDSFRIENKTSGSYVSRFTIAANGQVTVPNLLNADGGLDVAGNITLTGTVDGVDIAALNTTVSNINTDLVVDTTPQLGGDLASNGNDIDFADNDKATFGTGEDLQIYHNGTAGYIDSTGNDTLFIRNGTTGGNIKIQGNSGEESIVVNHNGSVELYHDDSKKFETNGSGADVTGNLNVSNGVDVTGNLTVSGTVNSGATTVTGNVSVTGDVSVTGGITSTTTISDSKGEVRNVPQVTTNSNLVVVASHAGKHLLHNGTGGWTINTSTGFAVGDLVTFINNTGSAQSIFQAGGVTLYDAADGGTGDHSVAARGMVTAINVATNVFYLSGSIE